jgi:hypothetical protein
MSIEQRLADKFAETAIRMDFDPDQFGYMLSKCGVHIQVAMFKVLLSLVEHWTMDEDYHNDRGMAEYGKITRHARLLRDTINAHEMWK